MMLKIKNLRWLIVGLLFIATALSFLDRQVLSISILKIQTDLDVRMGKRVPEVIIGTLEDDPGADAEIARFCGIAHVLHDLKNARIGHFGHPIESMLDMHSDPTMLTSAFGCHVVQTEAEDILKHFYQIDDDEVARQELSILDFFGTPTPVSDPVTKRLSKEDLYTAARVSIALERFVEEKNLDIRAVIIDQGLS